ncbi:2Fe-2S iron-sulfur cluster binding domain-containing protein (plasmid) [Agrobacterium tumefaciens]|uniref:2Fe-2S iron-sulfur cluster binding domain-containing protein n=1 Tax=Agrobacterium tumefaciens TaxID=358 RepID=A0AAJ4N8G4_AGRTU|nr:2Fe-2S iron-sulfur cluster binding domain-containing protein [Agrobacterium tumefaciens]
MPTLIVTDRSGQDHQLSGDRLTSLSLMEIIRDSGAEQILALCGGCCSCSTCHIFVDEADWGRLPPMTDDENELLEVSDNRNALSRLSCQVRFRDDLDGLRVTVAPE